MTLSKPDQFRVGVFGRIVVSIKLRRRWMALSGDAVKMSESPLAKKNCGKRSSAAGLALLMTFVFDRDLWQVIPNESDLRANLIS